MGKFDEIDRIKRMNDHIERQREKASSNIAQSDLAGRRREAMESHPDYQRKQRLGHDGRMREGVEKLAKNIHERNQMNDACPSFTKAQEAAARSADRVNQKLNEK